MMRMMVMVLLAGVVVGCNTANELESRADVEIPTFTPDQLRSVDDIPALREAAEAEQPEAMFLLGREYLVGRFVEQDLGEAHAWFARADEAGSSAGTNALGVMYYESIGVKREYPRARELFLRAADAGNAKAMRNLGRMSEGGHGVEVDYKVAIEWYEKAFQAAGDDEHLKGVLTEMIANVKAKRDADE